MPDGPGGFTQGCTCPALLRVPLRFAPLRVRSYHALWPGFPARSAHGAPCDIVALQPPRRLDGAGLGCSPFARRYWGNHSYFLFLRVLRCFSSPRWPPAMRDNARTRWVLPFGHPRIKGHLHLRADFRSLSRPSSPPRAKASAMCPFLLFCRFTSKPCGYGRNILSALTLLFLLQHVIDRRNIPATVSRKGLAAPILLFLKWRITDSNR